MEREREPKPRARSPPSSTMRESDAETPQAAISPSPYTEGLWTSGVARDVQGEEGLLSRQRHRLFTEWPDLGRSKGRRTYLYLAVVTIRLKMNGFDGVSCGAKGVDVYETVAPTVFMEWCDLSRSKDQRTYIRQLIPSVLRWAVMIDGSGFYTWAGLSCHFIELIHLPGWLSCRINRIVPLMCRRYIRWRKRIGQDKERKLS